MTPKLGVQIHAAFDFTAGLGRSGAENLLKTKNINFRRLLF
jgi:hypothetical protein